MKKEKALLLLSGGIDSPVAGIITKEKGFLLEAVHFSQKPFTGDEPEKKSMTIAKKIGLKELIVFDIGDSLKEIADKTFREYYFVLMKIFMFKVSERIANKKKIRFLCTGESLGQVSSQTLSNLNTINSSIHLQVLRPLLFLNKQEIIDISKEKGLYEMSTGKEMCDALATGKPKTITKIEKVKQEEKKCDINELVGRAMKKMRIEKIQ